jgi:hypothetical protein
MNGGIFANPSTSTATSSRANETFTTFSETSGFPPVAAPMAFASSAGRCAATATGAAVDVAVVAAFTGLGARAALAPPHAVTSIGSQKSIFRIGHSPSPEAVAACSPHQALLHPARVMTEEVVGLVVGAK